MIDRDRLGQTAQFSETLKHRHHALAVIEL
jgi:hypothetical protein